MYPLIFLDEKYENSFETRRLKYSLIDSLEHTNSNFTLSINDDTFDIVHFLNIDDLRNYIDKLKPSIKKCISLFYNEEDEGTKLLKEVRSKNSNEIVYRVTKKDALLLNKLDCIFVPSTRAKEYLQFFGVTTRIEVYLSLFKAVRFNLQNDVLAKAIYRYLGINEDSYIITSSFHFNDLNAILKINEIAKTYPRLKFICLIDKDINKVSNSKIKKIIKEKPKNLYFIYRIAYDLYSSLFYNSRVYLNLSSSVGNIEEVIDAMQSKTQVLSLKNACFDDITIDKENSYTYNNFNELVVATNHYYEGLLPSTIEGGLNYSKAKSFNNSANKLIDIYKSILKEN